MKRYNIFRVYIGMVCAGMSVGVLCAADETIRLTEDTEYVLPTNKNHWHNGSCTITSAYTEDKKNLTVIGGEESGLLQHNGNGKFIGNGSAVLENLGVITIQNSTNKWPDWGGEKNDAAGKGYGGVICADRDQGDSVEFNNNTAVIFQNVVYDCSDWGNNFTNSSVYGGAIYTLGGGHVKFVGNYSVELDEVGIASLQDGNYSYKNFYGYGGAVYTPELTIKSTSEPVTVKSCFINQGIATDVQGIGMGGAFYVDKMHLNQNESTISFNDNMIHMANDVRGGAVYLAKGSSEIDRNALHVQFSNNSVTAATDKNYNLIESSLAADCMAYGGAIFLADSDAQKEAVSLKISNNEGNVLFEFNTATADYTNVTNKNHGDDHLDDPVRALGGAVYVGTHAQLSIENNGLEGNTAYGKVTFSNNKVEAKGSDNLTALGGAVYLAESSSFIVQQNRGKVIFTGNAAVTGGGIYADANTVVTLSENVGGVQFADNSVSAYGAAVYSEGTLDIISNGPVSFTGNTADFGGAIYAETALSINENESVSFTLNEAEKGGAIYAGGDVEILKNGAVEFVNNGTNVGYDSGSAIYAESNVTVDIKENGSVSFSGDNSINPGSLVYLSSGAKLNLCDNKEEVSISAYAADGIVCGASGSVVNISGNDTVNVTGCETTHGAFYLKGGALSIENNNNGVTLSGNSAFNGYGAVVRLDESGASLSLSHNTGDIKIENNYATRSGGFVYVAKDDSSVSISDNVNVSVFGNSARSGAGAIDMLGNLQIRNNSGAVVFGNNSVYDDETQTTVLKAINAGSSSFSAPNGGSVEFRDSVSISGNLELNADYNSNEQRGEIIFTGQYTAAYAAAQVDSEPSLDIDASLHSKVGGDITLANGTLKIADKAVLEGDSLSVYSGKNARLVLSGGGSLVVTDALRIGNDTVLQAGAEDAAAAIPFRTDAESLADLIFETPVCGSLDCAELTLASGSTYALYGGILHLSEGVLSFEEGAAITLTGTNTPVSLQDDSILLLFSGVSAMEAADVSLIYNGVTYGDENLVFDSNEGVVYLRDVAVPEPSSAVLSIAGLTLLMMRRRRKASFSSAA